MIYSAWASAEDDILVDTPEKARKGIEQLTLEKFAGLKGSSIQELEETYDMADQNMLSKSYFFTLTMRILGTKKKYIPEFEKADITVKTIRLQKNGNPKESMSFPAFKFKDILEQDWEQSSLNERLNHKFFFVVFQYDSNGILRFKKAMFWNMPYKDRLLAQQAWEKTQKAISDSAPQDFPKARTSEVVHVRPHGRNAQDTLKLPDGTLHTKQCFWLNAGYIADQIRD